jgi:hypothetical protein
MGDSSALVKLLYGVSNEPKMIGINNDGNTIVLPSDFPKDPS